MEARGTTNVLEETQTRPLHLLPHTELAQRYVSSQSRWTDAKWIFDNPTPGAKNRGSRISWDLDLPDGRSLLDPIHAELLGWLRRFAWSLFSAPGDNAETLKPGSASTFGIGLRYFAIWMVDTGRYWPHDLDRQAFTEYCDDLKTMRLLSNEDEEITSEASLPTVVIRVRILTLLWQQRAALRAAGIEPPPRQPFDGQGAEGVSKEITSQRKGWIQPLPDEVALLVMNVAWDFLDVPARDICALQDACLAAYERAPSDHFNGPGTSKSSRQNQARHAAEAFRFRCRPGESRPWHAPLRVTDPETDDFDTVSTRKGETGQVELGVMQQVRRLVLDLTHACALVVQATTGMRVSEICGLPAGINPETGLPSCVRIEDSATGLNELFLVHTRLSKTEATPRSVDWVLGMRPKNRDVEAESWPPAVQALIILNELLAPYRKLAESDDLIVLFSNNQGLPRNSSGVGRVQAGNLLQGMRAFAARHVDWSALSDESPKRFEAKDLAPYKESKGRIIRSHQWRKLFANFAIRVDPGLLPTLQMHFHHVSLAMTEGGYVGSDPSLLSEVQSARDQMTSLYMWEIANGKASLENLGSAGQYLSQTVADELLPRTEGQPAEVAWRETVRFTEELGATFAFSPYATCAAYLLSEMRCHQEAGTMALARWRHNLQPNFAHRRPQICAGCKNAVFDARHRPFWIDRYAENRQAVQQAREMGETAGLQVFEANMVQARNILRQIGEDVDALDAWLDDQQNPRTEVGDA